MTLSCCGDLAAFVDRRVVLDIMVAACARASKERFAVHRRCRPRPHVKANAVEATDGPDDLTALVDPRGASPCRPRRAEVANRASSHRAACHPVTHVRNLSYPTICPRSLIAAAPARTSPRSRILPFCHRNACSARLRRALAHNLAPVVDRLSETPSSPRGCRDRCTFPFSHSKRARSGLRPRPSPSSPPSRQSGLGR